MGVMFYFIAVSVFGVMLWQSLARLYAIFTSAKTQYEPQDFGAAQMSKDIFDMHETLEAQGLIPLDGAFLRMPVVNQTFPAWFYTNDSAIIWAELGQINKLEPVMTGLTSVFEDDSIIITRYPIGETIDAPRYHARFARHSFAAAYDYHVQKVEEWRHTHGEPRLIMGMEDVIAGEDVYHEHACPYDVKRTIWVRGAMAVIAAVALLLTLAAILSDLQTPGSITMTSPLFAAIIIAGILSLLIPMVIEWSLLRKSHPLDKAKPRRFLAAR